MLPHACGSPPSKHCCDFNGRKLCWLPLQGGRGVHRGGLAGYTSGEGPGVSTAPRHRVKIFNHYADQEIEVEVPEDRCAQRSSFMALLLFALEGARHKVSACNASPCRCRYVLWEAEDQGLELPYACRMGCCTACAVKVKEGEMYQPQSLGVSKELRERVRHAPARFARAGSHMPASVRPG